MKIRLPHDPELPIALAAFCLLSTYQYRVAENRKETYQLSASRRAYKARTLLGLSTIILSSNPPSASSPGTDSSWYVMHHGRYQFDILIDTRKQEHDIYTNPSMRRTCGLPRRGYNALHSGLVWAIRGISLGNRTILLSWAVPI
jgi:hypothetical protein